MATARSKPRSRTKIKPWREHELLADTLARVGRQRFVRLDDLIQEDPSRGPFVACLMTTSVDLQTFALADVPSALPLLNIWPVTSYGVACGWIFEFPRLVFRFAASFMSICSADVAGSERFDNVEQVFANSWFSVFSAEDKSTLVTLNRQRLITWEG